MVLRVPRAVAQTARRESVIIPCIDLMDGKVVQLVQGRDKAIEEDSALAVHEIDTGNDHG